MPETRIAGVLELAEQWETPLPREVAVRLVTYLGDLLKWNERVNLTGARTIDELVGDHLPDSFALAKLCPPQASLVDVGSGGGLPAIPFAILRPDCRVTLVEPRAKRIAFLNAAARASGPIRVLRSRMEDLPGSGFSVASSRATFPPQEWLVMAPRLLSVGGTAILFTTAPLEVQITSARMVDSVSYSTSSGAPRWCAAFCFT